MNAGDFEEGRDGNELTDQTLRDEAAREFVADGVRSVSSLVRNTFGPRGMETLVETETPEGEPEIVLTGDSGEIFDAIERADGFRHPVSALLVDAVDSMGRALSDGGTTATLLTEEFVSRGMDLVERGLHPNTVVVGYAMAASMTGELLDELARPVGADDRETLERVAATAMVDELSPVDRDAYAEMIARAVRRLAADADGDFLDTDDAKVVGTTREETDLYDGVVVRRWARGAETSERSNVGFDPSPSITEPITDAQVAVIDAEIDFEETATNLGGDATTGGIEVQTAEALANYREEFDRQVKAAAERVRGLGVDVLVSQPSVDRRVSTAFEQAGVTVVDGVETPRADIHRIASATDATVVSYLTDLTPERLGTVGRVTERRVGDERWTLFEGGAGDGVVSLVVRAGTDTNAGRCERLVADALDATAVAVTDGQTLPGAGAPPLAAAAQLRERASGVSGVEQLAVEEFADALEAVFAQLVRNAGLDPLDVRTALRSRHAEADAPVPVGVDLDTGEAVDAYEAGVVEPRRIFSQAIETARTATDQLLTTDAVFYPDVDLAEFSPEMERQ